MGRSSKSEESRSCSRRKQKQNSRNHVYKHRKQREYRKKAKIRSTKHRHSSDSRRSEEKIKSKKTHQKNRNNHTKRKYQSSSSSSSETSSSSSSSVTGSSSRAQKQNKSVSEDAGHYNFQLQQSFNGGKYVATKFLSDGTFGRVIEVENQIDKRVYAMKIIRAVERYVESARTEEYILKYLNSRDPKNEFKCVRLIEAFERKQNYCMVFERLGLSLYDIMKKNDFVGFPLRMLQSFFKQILQGVGFMHALQITHTDLKPENILVCSTELVKQRVRVGRSKSNSEATKKVSESEDDFKKIYLPEKPDIKIIDMGGATFEYEHHSATINTRQYRAPEVILGCCKWGLASDIWGVACIVLELYAGELFFQTRKSDYEHLAMIEKVCGPIPQWMVNRTASPLDKHFTMSNSYFQRYNTYYTWTRNGATQENLFRIQKLKNVEDLVSLPSLVNLLRKMLTIDPNKRINCQEALQHPFFREEFQD